MRNADAIMIRYMGADHARRFVIQRADDKFWTGSNWDKVLDCAKVFREHAAAQKECVTIQYGRHRGKPVRMFKVEMTITLVADEVESITEDALDRFLSEAVRIDIETSIHGDGPVAGSYVEARLKLDTLKETQTKRKVF